MANHSLGLLGVGMKSCPSQPSPAGPLSCTVFVLESGWLALPWCSLNLKVESGDYGLSPTCKLLFLNETIDLFGKVLGQLRADSGFFFSSSAFCAWQCDWGGGREEQ